MNRRFLLVAVLLAGLSAALVYAKISADSGSGGSSGAAGDQQVVVARSDIKERTQVTAEMLEVKSVPLSAVVTGAYTNPEEVVGKVTRFPISPNDQVTSSAVIDTSKPVTDAALSLVVPVGKRATAVQASQLINAGGLVLPGDWVDVSWTCCDDKPVVARTILRNVQVVAVAQTIIPSGPVTSGGETSGENGGTSTNSSNPVAAEEGEADPAAATVTLLLTPAEIQDVHLAEGRGSFRIGLRGLGDQDTPDAGFTLLTELMPVSELASLPEGLKPDGYRAQQ
jgi:pilus assembly protein CpaB